MSDRPAELETWEVLKLFGFDPNPNPHVISDIRPGLSVDFGNLVLSASAVMNLRFQDVISFTGILKESNFISQIQFEMPRQIESIEKAAAWLAWNLDQHAGGEFRPLCRVPWLDLGRWNQTLLPWVEDLAAYEARPCCLVDRDWARKVLDTLSTCILDLSDDTPVVFSFDGEVLKIRCGEKLIATAGNGKPWQCRYSLKAGQLRDLPKRLNSQRVVFSEWKGKFTISNWVYEGVVVQAGREEGQ